MSNALDCADNATGATHLFEEPGALETVADEAAAWFEKHLFQGQARNDRQALNG